MRSPVGRSGDSGQKTVIWDFEGTLAWREGLWSGALARVAQEHDGSLEVVAEDFRPHLLSGFPWHTPENTYGRRSPDEWWRALEQVFDAAFRALGYDPSESLEMSQRVKGVFLDPAYWQVYDDVDRCLGRLSEFGWRHVILSNHVPELRSLVGDLALHHHFDAVISSAETGYEKPHAGAFRSVTAAAGADSTRVMVGDSYLADVKGAEDAGIPAVLVRKRHPDARNCIDGLEPLPTLLERLIV